MNGDSETPFVAVHRLTMFCRRFLRDLPKRLKVIDWAPRDKILKSFELLARYVMPQFQGSVVGIEASNKWATGKQEELVAGRVRAIERAQQVYTERNR